jgi:Zn-dependent protease with chaperone function
VAIRDSSEPARPDTFQFPPETTFRFYALLATLFGTLTFVWGWLYLTLPSSRHTAMADLSVCLGREIEVARACLRNFNLGQGNFVAACLAVTVLVVLVLHLLHALYIITAQRLRPLETVADPETLPPFRAALDTLIAQAGLAHPPHVLIRARARTDAFTFGNWFRHYLCLDSGLVGEFFINRAAFDAKIRHELAHFRNKDISKADVTTVSWWLFALLVPLVFIYGLLQHSTSTEDVAALSWRFAVIIAAVWLARNAVIRAREFDADARAFAWDGPDGALITTLKAQKGGTESRWRLPGLLRLHPSNSERITALEKPGRMLRTQILLLPAILGLAFGIGEPPGRSALSLVVTPAYLAMAATVAACIFLLPMAGWAGVAIWRDAYCSPRRGRADLASAAFGLAAAAGVIGGFHLSFTATIGPMENLEPALVILILTLFFLWIRAGSYWWLSSNLGRRFAVSLCWTSIAMGSFVLITMWTRISAMNMLHNAAAGVADVNPLATVWLFFLAMTTSPLVLLFFLVLWLFIVAPRWIGLPPRSRSAVLRRRTVHCLNWTLAYAALVLGLRLYVTQLATPEMRDTPEFKIWSFGLYLSVAALLQGGLAFFMVLRRPAATIGEACFCTLLAGILMSIAVLAINRAASGGLSVDLVVNTVCMFANAGAFVALPVSALGAGLRFIIEGFRPMPVSPTTT